MASVSPSLGLNCGVMYCRVSCCRPKADVFSAGVVAAELNTGTPPKPGITPAHPRSFMSRVYKMEVNIGLAWFRFVLGTGPQMKKIGRRRVGVDEEERRADDIAAVRHPEIKRIVLRWCTSLLFSHTARSSLRTMHD